MAKAMKMGDAVSTDNLIMFATEDGTTRVEVRFEHDNAWLTQKQMAQIYECSSDNISLHLKIFLPIVNLIRRQLPRIPR